MCFWAVCVWLWSMILSIFYTLNDCVDMDLNVETQIKAPDTITLYRYKKKTKKNIICVEYDSVNSMLKTIFNHFHSFSPQCMWEKFEDIKGPIKSMYHISCCNFYLYFGLLFIGFVHILADILFSTRKVVNVCLHDRQTSWKSVTKMALNLNVSTIMMH